MVKSDYKCWIQMKGSLVLTWCYTGLWLLCSHLLILIYISSLQPTLRKSKLRLSSKLSLCLVLSRSPGCLRVIFRLSFVRLWPPGNRSSLPSDYQENHLIWVNSYPVVPLELSLVLSVFGNWSPSPASLPGHHENSLSLVLSVFGYLSPIPASLPGHHENHLIWGDSIPVVSF
jgi:hypothetical protein